MTTTAELKNGQLMISGDLLFTSVPMLLKQSRLLLTEQETADINLEGVGRSDSSGLAFIFAMMRHAKANNKTIHLKHIPAQLIALAKIASVDQLINQE